MSINFKGATTDHKSSLILTKGGNKNFSFETGLPIPLDPWSLVLNSSYGSNIIAAYDFRDYTGTTINAKAGPDLITQGNVTFDSDGAVFTRSPNSYMYTNDTVSVTYPFTMVYVGKIQGTTYDPVHIAVQPVKWTQTSLTNAVIFSRSSQGILGYNGSDNNAINYVPDNTEWYYLAISFLNGSYRYQLRKASGDLNGTEPAVATPTAFNGYIGVGAGFGSATTYNFNGNMRLALLINQGFSTEQEMDDLFNTFINGGPASDLTL